MGKSTQALKLLKIDTHYCGCYTRLATKMLARRKIQFTLKIHLSSMSAFKSRDVA